MMLFCRRLAEHCTAVLCAPVFFLLLLFCAGVELQRQTVKLLVCCRVFTVWFLLGRTACQLNDIKLY